MYIYIFSEKPLDLTALCSHAAIEVAAAASSIPVTNLQVLSLHLLFGSPEKSKTLQEGLQVWLSSGSHQRYLFLCLCARVI